MTLSAPKPPRRLDMIAALNACGTGDWTHARAERAHSEALAERHERGLDKHSLLLDPADWITARTLTSTPFSAGGALTNVTMGPTAPALRPLSVLVGLGAQVAVANRGQRWPRVTTGITATWQSAEEVQIASADAAFGDVAAQPQTLVAVTTMSKTLFTQSGSDVVEDDLRRAIGEAIDRAALGGTGSAGEPLGLINTPGTHSVAGATFSRAKAREMARRVHDAGGVVSPGAVGYVTTPTVAELLAERAQVVGSDRGIFEGELANGTIAGARAVATGSAPPASLVFGDWSQLAIVFLGPIEITVDIYSASLWNTGRAQIRALAMADVVVGQPGSFCISTGLT